MPVFTAPQLRTRQRLSPASRIKVQHNSATCAIGRNVLRMDAAACLTINVYLAQIFEGSRQLLSAAVLIL